MCLDNEFDPGPTEEHPCPCNWKEKEYHLTKCNYITCGPPPGTSNGPAMEMPRLKTQTDMVSDFQAFCKIGGSELWMTLETGVGTTWVMSKACFTEGCKKTELFSGAFLPAMPPQFVPIDLFERGTVIYC